MLTANGQASGGWRGAGITPCAGPPDSHAPVLSTAAGGCGWGARGTAEGAGFLALAPGPPSPPRQGTGSFPLQHDGRPKPPCSLPLPWSPPGCPLGQRHHETATSLASPIAGPGGDAADSTDTVVPVMGQARIGGFGVQGQGR